MRLQDQVAVVTGAGRGIGAAIVRRFADEGCAVVIAEVNKANGEQMAQAIQRAGGRALAMPTDVSDMAQCQHAVQTAVAHFGTLNILVNNAAIAINGDFVSGDLDVWQRHIQVNLMGAVYCSRAAAQVMPPGSRIVNISSIHNTRAELGTSAYDVAKGGLDQLTRTLALQLAERAIRVNAVAPGFIDAPMAIIDGESELETDHFKDNYIERRKIPMARPGTPDEVAGAVLFLATEDSSYVNGHVLRVDGGLATTF